MVKIKLQQDNTKVDRPVIVPIKDRTYKLRPGEYFITDQYTGYNSRGE